MKTKILLGKGQIGKNVHGVWKVFWNRGESETGDRNASLPQRVDASAWRHV